MVYFYKSQAVLLNKWSEHATLRKLRTLPLRSQFFLTFKMAETENLENGSLRGPLEENLSKHYNPLTRSAISVSSFATFSKVDNTGHIYLLIKQNLHFSH